MKVYKAKQTNHQYSMRYREKPTGQILTSCSNSRPIWSIWIRFAMCSKASSTKGSLMMHLPAILMKTLDLQVRMMSHGWPSSSIPRPNEVNSSKLWSRWPTLVASASKTTSGLVLFKRISIPCQANCSEKWNRSSNKWSEVSTKKLTFHCWRESAKPLWGK